MKLLLLSLILCFATMANAQTMGNIIQHGAGEIFGDNGVVSGASIISNPMEHLNDFQESRDAAKDFFDSFNTLSSAECSPDFSNTNVGMEATCQENEACYTCYESAKTKMDFFRRQLGRLNCIYTNTTTFSKNAIAFGDNTSGVHAMAGLAWQKQKSTINKSLEKLKVTYDTKYIEFIDGLKDALKEFNECELKFGSKDWFDKSGFIYFEFMKERYKRKD